MLYNRARFLSEDPFGFISGDVNPYRYAGNNFPNKTDRTGLMPGSVGIDDLADHVPLLADLEAVGRANRPENAFDRLDQGVDDFYRGAGDAISFGLTQQFREWNHSDPANYDSAWVFGPSGGKCSRFEHWQRI